MLSVIKVPKDLCSTRGQSNHLPSAVDDFAAFQPFGQTFCVLGTCLRQASGTAGNFSPCDSYLPGKAGKGKQVYAKSAWQASRDVPGPVLLNRNFKLSKGWLEYAPLPSL